jgi:hypothetical protein
MSTLRSALALWTLALILLTSTSHANPFPLEYDGVLLNRACATACGSQCCNSGSTCGVNSAGQPTCLETASGTWQYYTFTYTQTDFVTGISTSSSYITPTPTATSACQASLGETQCGGQCCGAAETCEDQRCVAGGSSAAVATPPLRQTSSGVSTVTQTGTPTTGFIAPIDSSGATVIAQASTTSGLSGGAIAGIVIGVLAGVVLLLILCAWCCVRGALDGLLALLGLGRRRRQETTYIEERRSRRTGGAQAGRRTWFGTRHSAEGSEKGSSGLGFWATLALILGAISLCLGLRRRDDGDEKTEYTYEYYDTSESKL